MAAVAKWLPVAAVGAVAIAARRRTTADTCVAVPAHDPPGAERCARGDNRSADTWPRSVASHRAPAHRARHAPNGISISNGAVRSTRRLGAGYAHAPSPKPPGPCGPASSPFSAVDLFQRLNRQFALGDHAFELDILYLQLAQSLHFRRLQRPEPSPPHVDRLLADLVLPGHFHNRTAISFAQDRDHLLFSKSTFLHQLLASSAGAIVSSYYWSEKPGQVRSRRWILRQAVGNGLKVVSPESGLSRQADKGRGRVETS